MSLLTVKAEIFDRPDPPATTERQGFDRFGFVPLPLACTFAGGEIVPVDEHEAVAAWVEAYSYRTNVLPPPRDRDWRYECRILFPPMTETVSMDPRDFEAGDYSRRVLIPNSRHPATVHRVPVSHHLRLDDFADHMAREAAAGFVSKTFAFLFDTPAQFHDWWFDGAVSIGGDQLDPSAAAAGAFLTAAYRSWRSWALPEQQVMIALLKMHARAPGHQWYWERFAWEYSVTDACYRIAAEVFPGQLKTQQGKLLRHSKRISEIVGLFGLSHTADEADWLNTFVCLRNELIHEARWAGNQPSTKTPTKAIYAPAVLHQLNQRLVTALLGYQNRFRVTRWDGMGHITFDV